MIIFITLLAWITHVFSKLMKANKKFKPNFEIKTWLENNIYYLIFSLLCVILALTFVNFKEIKDVEQFGVIISLKHVVAFFIGWAAPSIINKVVKSGNKKLKENE